MILLVYLGELECLSLVLKCEIHTFMCVLQLFAEIRPQKCILLCI